MPFKMVKQVYLYFCQKADTTLTYETYAYSRKWKCVAVKYSLSELTLFHVDQT